MTKFTTQTRWQYYVANVAGILTILVVLGWCLVRILTGAFDLSSGYLWVALFMLILLPFTLIGFFSSMKAVEVTATGIIISYEFQRHRNTITFSEMAKVQSQGNAKTSGSGKRSFRNTFTLVLKDGRAFEFDRSQFPQYDKLKAICTKATAQR